MSHHEAAATYRRTSVETAPPIKIVRMLYAGALRFLDQAASTDRELAAPEFVSSIQRASAIVCELRCALDRSHAPELVDRLDELYGYVEGCLSEATLERSLEAVECARRVLATLKDAWDQVELDAGAGAAAGPA